MGGQPADVYTPEPCVQVCGVVTRRTGVFPQLKVSHFNCGKCGSVIGPFSNVSDKEVRYIACNRVIPCVCLVPPSPPPSLPPRTLPTPHTRTRDLPLLFPLGCVCVG